MTNYIFSQIKIVTSIENIFTAMEERKQEYFLAFNMFYVQIQILNFRRNTENTVHFELIIVSVSYLFTILFLHNEKMLPL